MYTKFNKGFSIRDDVGVADMLILSSEDLGFTADPKDKSGTMLKRSVHLKDIVGKRTTCLALVT
jgi:hypothetical protein